MLIPHTVNAGIEARLLFHFYIFGADLYLSFFFQFLLNKILILCDFFSLLFENAFYSKQSSIPKFTVNLKCRGRGGGEWEGTKINHNLKELQGTCYCLFSYWRRGSDCYFHKLRSDIRIDHTILHNTSSRQNMSFLFTIYPPMLIISVTQT